jgi:hypothetical protein
MSNRVEDRLIKESKKVSQYREWLSGRKLSNSKLLEYVKLRHYVTEKELFNK